MAPHAWRSSRLHSVSKAFAQRCWRLHSAHLGVLHFLNAMETLEGRHSGVTGV